MYQSAGILAYCTSFANISKRYLGNLYEQIPPFNEVALKESLEAKALEQTYAAVEWGAVAGIRLAKASNWRSSILLLSAILVALLVMFVQPQIDKGETASLVAASKYIAAHILHFLGGIFVLLLIVWVFTHPNWAINRRFGRDILEVANVKRRASIFVFTFIALIVFIGAIWLGRAAMYDMLTTLRELFHLLVN